MLFKTEKYKKDVRDVMLVFLYLGIIFLMFSSLIINSFFFIDLLIIGVFFLGIGLGMGIIVAYYYMVIKKHSKKKHKIGIERMLVLYVIFGIFLLLLTLVLVFNFKIWSS